MSKAAPVSLPHISILSFDPTAHAADQKKGATGEAARPVGEAMLDTITTRTQTQQGRGAVGAGNRGDGVDRAYIHAEQWLAENLARGRNEIFSAEFTITPQIAALLLKKNPDNRHLKKRRIAEIRADLEGGRYVLNGEPIIVSKDGLLNDGQHRLIACVESGVTFRSVVVFGVSRSSRTTLDQGGARTTADYLDMQGGSGNTIVQATVARMLWQYQQHGRVFVGGGMNKRNNSRTWPTKAEILDFAAEHERDIFRNIQAVTGSSKLVGSFSLVVLARLLLERADQTMGPVFIDRLLDGANLEVGSPIFLLRERFINDPKMRQPERFEAIIRAWNAMRKGNEIKKIQIMGNVPKIER